MLAYCIIQSHNVDLPQALMVFDLLNLAVCVLGAIHKCFSAAVQVPEETTGQSLPSGKLQPPCCCCLNGVLRLLAHYNGIGSLKSCLN